VQQFSGKDP